MEFLWIFASESRIWPTVYKYTNPLLQILGPLSPVCVGVTLCSAQKAIAIDFKEASACLFSHTAMKIG